jgi:cysteine-rich repeat protein
MGPRLFVTVLSWSAAGSLLGACAAGNGGVGGDGGSSSTGTPTACMPGEKQACYDGPDGTLGIGACKAGEATCAADGSGFGACEGAVVPGVEDCDAAMTDEDCDGKVNDKGKSCVCGDGFLSNAEECDDGNTSKNDGCDPTCHIERVQAVAIGGGHVCALVPGGIVKCWGANGAGQLGLEDTNDRGDQPAEMGAQLGAVKLGSGRSALSIAVGASHSCAVLDDESLKCWGLNADGQLGQGDGISRGTGPAQMGDSLLPIRLGSNRTAKAVATGASHTCAVLDDGSLKCWGRNSAGQLGSGYIIGKGKVPSDMGDGLPVVPLGTGRTVKLVSCGLTHSCVLLDDDTVKCWGSNDYGELGIGTTVPHGGGLGEMGDGLPTVDLGTGRIAKTLAVGYGHACALLDDGSVKCWGKNDAGQLGLGDTLPRGDQPGEMGDALEAVDLGPGRKAVAISAGGATTCAVLDDASLKCWGQNLSGGLGQGDSTARGDTPGELGAALSPVNLGKMLGATKVANDDGSTCAITTAGSIKCWGKNDAGQLGQGDKLTRGNGSGQLGDALPFVRLMSDKW